MKGLDLSRLKKVSSDDKSTVFKHEMGHEIKIAHAGLSPEMLKKVQGLKLARGGEIAADEDAPHIKGVNKSWLAKNDAGMSESGLRLRQGKGEEAVKTHKNVLSEMKSMPKPDLYAQGGETGINKTTPNKGQSEAGSQLKPAFQISPEFSKEKAKETHRKTLSEMQSMPKPKLMADGGDMPNPQPNSTPDDTSPPPAASPVVINVGGGGSTPAASNPAPPQAPASPAAQAPVAPAVPESSQAPQADVANAPTQPVVPVQPMGPPAPPTAGQVLTQPTSADDALAHLNDQTQKLRDDFNNGHITPKTYSDLFAKNSDGTDRGTLSKIGMIFGLMAGGMGSGLTHQPNALLGMMDREIDRDLEAQKQAKSNQFNALNLAETHYRNEVQNHLAVQQGAQTEQNTKLAKVQTGVAAQALGRSSLENAVYADQLRKIGMLPPGSPMAQKGQAALGMLNNAITAQQGQRNAKTAQQIEMNGKQFQQSQPKTTEPDANGNYILGPNAENIYTGLKNIPISDKQKSDAADQYNHAVQVEKALKQIDQLQPKAAGTTTFPGSIANGLEGTIGQIPFGIGKVLGNLPGEAIRDLGGQKEKLNQKYQTQLRGYIDSALQGTGATPTDIDNMAREYMPKESESPEVQAASLKGLKDKLINLTKTGAMPKDMLREQ